MNFYKKNLVKLVVFFSGRSPKSQSVEYPCPKSMVVKTKDATSYAIKFGKEVVEQCSFPCNADAAKPVRLIFVRGARETKNGFCLILFPPPPPPKKEKKFRNFVVVFQLFFERTERHFLRLWIGFWATACAASTLFTVLTFCVDMNRFPYPVRPIFFLAICYLFISVVYIVGKSCWLVIVTLACCFFRPELIESLFYLPPSSTHNMGPC